MDDSMFLGSDALSAIVAQAGQYVAFGVGMAISFTMLGIVLVWLYGYLRGGI